MPLRKTQKTDLQVDIILKMKLKIKKKKIDVEIIGVKVLFIYDTN